MTTRRELLAAIGASAFSAPLASFAQRQPPKVARIGFLGSETAAAYAGNLQALRAGLREHGYVEGRNIVIEFAWAEGDTARLPELATRLVRSKVDVIVTHGTPGTRAARRATTTIPIVIASIGDPVAMGIVPSIARPSGNVTGSVSMTPELMTKRLELLMEAMPRIARIAVLANPDNPAIGSDLGSMERAAKSRKLDLQRFEVYGPADFASAFAQMASARVEAIIIQQDGMLNGNLVAIAALAAKQRLPAVGVKELPEVGGLLGYGVVFQEMYRRAAYFVDQIGRAHV